MKAIVLLATAGLLAAAAPAAAYCPCVANGQLFDQGAVACLKVSGGEYLARCDAILNNSSWTRIGDTCPKANTGDTTQGLFEFDEDELRDWDEGTAQGQCQVPGEVSGSRNAS